MAKTKSTKFHKIKVHHNRWLIWTIAYLLFVAIALIGYLKISDLNLDSENVDVKNLTSSHTFTDSKQGYSVRYPSGWSIESNYDSSISFLPSDTEDSGVTISAVASSAEKSIRKALKISSETKTTLDSAPAAKIVNDLGSGHSETVILSNHNQKLYVIRGSDSFVEKIMMTFHFLTK